jgi:hypothetical protein
MEGVSLICDKEEEGTIFTVELPEDDGASTAVRVRANWSDSVATLAAHAREKAHKHGGIHAKLQLALRSEPGRPRAVLHDEDALGDVMTEADRDRVVAAAPEPAGRFAAIGLAAARLEKAEAAGETLPPPPPEARRAFDFDDLTFTVADRATREPKRLVAGVSGAVRSGEIMAVLGPSGSGKSTLVAMLTLRTATGAASGAVRIDGAKLTAARFRRSCFVVEQRDELWPYLTCRESMAYAAALYGAPGRDPDAHLDRLGLASCADTLVGTHFQPGPAWNSNLQPDFNVRICDSFDASSLAVLRELDESNRFVQKSAESTSI